MFDAGAQEELAPEQGFEQMMEWALAKGFIPDAETLDSARKQFTLDKAGISAPFCSAAFQKRLWVVVGCVFLTGFLSYWTWTER